MAIAIQMTATAIEPKNTVLFAAGNTVTDTTNKIPSNANKTILI